ncbi:MAG: hypothetical protein WC227_02680 [Patescibacteria group bacterium]|jgi:hypothetical protein
MVNIAEDQQVKDIIEKDIFVLLKAENLSDEQKAILMAKLTDEANLRILIHVDEMLADSAKTEFKRIVSEGDSEMLSAFFVANNIDIAMIFADIALQLKAEVVAYNNYLTTSAKVLATSAKQVKGDK